MPYTIAKKDGRYCVYKKNEDGQPTGESLGCHDTLADAEAQEAVLYIAEDGGEEGKGSMFKMLDQNAETGVRNLLARKGRRLKAVSELLGDEQVDEATMHEVLGLLSADSKANAAVRRLLGVDGAGKGIDLDDYTRRVRSAWYETYDSAGAMMAEPSNSYVETVMDNAVIVEISGELWRVPYSEGNDGISFSQRSEWVRVRLEYVPYPETRPASNALKAVSKTDDELRVANYIVLYGGRDLEGLGSERVNEDGSLGEYFTPETELKSAYTETGRLYVDWEHGLGKHLEGDMSPGRDDVLGYVDWKTARSDERGMWVERVLHRRKKYVEWLETLIGAGLVGTSSEPVQDGVVKAADGHIVKWPLKRDALTVSPMDPRMLSDNVVQALKALSETVPELKALISETVDGNRPPEVTPEGAEGAGGDGEGDPDTALRVLRILRSKFE